MENKQTTKETVRILPLPDMFEVYEGEHIETHAVGAQQLVTPTYRIELPEEGGILSWCVGDKFPFRGWVFKEAIYAVDCVKRLTINIIKFFIYLPKNLLKRRVMRSAMELFVEYIDTVFDRFGRLMPLQDEKGTQFGLMGVYFKPKFFCNMVREIHRAGNVIVKGDELIKKLVRAICMIFEFDDAYRYRAQDIFGIVNKEALLKNPAKEIVRVLRIAKDRDSSGNGQLPAKIEVFIKIVPYLFWIRSFKKAFIEFFKEVDLEKLKLDEYDLYRCLLWGGWKFGGIEDVDRLSMRMMIDAEWKHGEDEKQKRK